MKHAAPAARGSLPRLVLTAAMNAVITARLRAKWKQNRNIAAPSDSALTVRFCVLSDT